MIIHSHNGVSPLLIACRVVGNGDEVITPVRHCRAGVRAAKDGQRSGAYPRVGRLIVRRGQNSRAAPGPRRAVPKRIVAEPDDIQSDQLHAVVVGRRA